MKDRLRDHRIADLSVAIAEDLPFRIATTDASVVAVYPSIFELGSAEYFVAIDSWNHHLVVGCSEVSVVSLDSNWLGVIQTCVEGAVCLRDQHDASSKGSLRPDATITVRGAIGLRAESKYGVTGINAAKGELADKMDRKSLRLFPKHQSHIIGVASTEIAISVYFIYWSEKDNRFSTHELRTFNVNDRNDRVMFIVMIFKISRWLSAITEPNAFFHLYPSVRTKTRNDHYVTLLVDGLMKEFNKKVPLARLQRMQEIVEADLDHVEYGERLSDRVFLIKTVGEMLRVYLSRFTPGAQKDRAKNEVMDAVRIGLEKIHEKGFAHCDICVDNVFFDEAKGIFLGDLEYLTPLDNPPPKMHHRLQRVSKIPDTARQLDEFELEQFAIDLRGL